MANSLEGNPSIKHAEELPTEKVVRHNLWMLDHSMVDLLGTESFGGNAGDIDIAGKNYPCGGANGFANPETGEIYIFQNPQMVPEYTRRHSIEFTLRVALDFTKGRYVKIVEFFGADRFSEQGRQAVQSAIDTWNHNRELQSQ